MTRIITIIGGLARVGKTHLGVNLSLELVRRGRSVCLYHEENGVKSISDILAQQPRSKQQHAQAGHTMSRELVCRGYQGLDIISCSVPLAEWKDLDDVHLESLLSAFDIQADYDDFLIDTSGMQPREIVACCKISAAVILIVTPGSQSHAEAFGLLRVLHSNHFANPVLLIVNKSTGIENAKHIHARFSEMASHYLAMDVYYLGLVTCDSSVDAAERSRQAFTSVFPDMDASADVIRLVDSLQRFPWTDIPNGVQDLASHWKRFAQIMDEPVHTAGDADLADFEAHSLPDSSGSESVKEGEDEELDLLRFEGPLSGLDDVMRKSPEIMRNLADDMQSLTAHLEYRSHEKIDIAADSLIDHDAMERIFSAVLGIIRQSDSPGDQVHFYVDESYVSGQDESWLKAGQYIKYAFLIRVADSIIGEIRDFMGRLPEVRHGKGPDGECICETVSPEKDACLSVIHTLQGDIRIRLWRQMHKICAPKKDTHAPDKTSTRTNLHSLPKEKVLH